MCEYCNEDARENAPKEEYTRKIFVRCGYLYLRDERYAEHPVYGIASKINYCPMCGRRLNNEHD